MHSHMPSNITGDLSERSSWNNMLLQHISKPSGRSHVHVPSSRCHSSIPQGKGWNGNSNKSLMAFYCSCPGLCARRCSSSPVCVTCPAGLGAGSMPLIHPDEVPRHVCPYRSPPWHSRATPVTQATAHRLFWGSSL